MESKIKIVWEAIEKLETLDEEIEKCENSFVQNTMQIIANTLEEEMREGFENLLADIFSSPQTRDKAQELIKANPAILANPKLFLSKLFFEEEELPELPEEMLTEFENLLNNTKDTGLAIVNDSPVVKKLLRPEAKRSETAEVKLSNREDAVFSIIDGYLAPYEKEMLEAISKYKLDGQVDKKGRVFCTVGQLYRGMRGGVKKSPTKPQRKEIMETLREMAKDERKLHFEMNDYLFNWGEFEVKGGKLGLVHYDEFFGQIKGQKETLIVFYETPLLCMMAEQLRMQEVISQDIKAIQYHGKDGNLKNYPLSKKRIALRSVIFSFVFGYIRARTHTPTSPAANHDNRLPYRKIFELCEIDPKDYKEVSRQKGAIFVILEHLKEKGVIASWSEYSNMKSKGKADGIRIRVSKELLEVE